MIHPAVTRRTVLRAAVATAATVAAPFTGGAKAAVDVAGGKLVLAWHTNIATRWLDPQQHDGTASPDNFLMALHDALIKNFREVHYDHPALASGYEFADDGKSATFHLRPGAKFHDGSVITPADVKWSYEHYRGAWGELLHKNTRDVEIVDNRTVRFSFRRAVLRFSDPFGHRQCVRRRLGGAGEIL